MRASSDTPPTLAKKLLQMINHKPGDRFYEPFRGKGSFYDNMPEPKDWAEIKMGRDFFTYRPFNGYCEHIVTNPPYRTYVAGRFQNAYIPILERCMDIATKTIAFLTNHKILNSLTPSRLEKYKNQGWAVTAIHIVSVRKWFGRYYFIIFRKNADSIISWDLETY